MRIAVPKETAPGERRVALVPESCKKLLKIGYEISIESSACDLAGFADAEYQELSVAVESDPSALVRSGDLMLKIGPPTAIETASMREGTIYVGSLMPL